MPPKTTTRNADDDVQSSENESDAPTVVRALESHAQRIEELVHADRVAANQTLERLLQDAHRQQQESQREMADAVANAVGRVLAQGLHHPGTAPPVPPQTTQPPITSFGGLRLQGGPPDSQPPVTVPPPADPWPPVSQSEFNPTPATHAAAVAAPDPRFQQQQPFGIGPPDPGRFYAPYDFAATQPYNVQVAGRQRVFTVQDPPTKRDIAEAFLHVQHASRHSPHIGKREITELQLLECFVQIWDCRCTGLPNREPSAPTSLGACSSAQQHVASRRFLSP
ncbi:amyloid beta A4 precursor protein-binding family B member 1-interacting protein-like [Ixodes scapularis]